LRAVRSGPKGWFSADVDGGVTHIERFASPDRRRA